MNSPLTVMAGLDPAIQLPLSTRDEGMSLYSGEQSVKEQDYRLI